jgi:hypothetical protein
VDRRQWLIVGVGLELLAVGFIAALFTTPLERHVFSGAGWFVIVTALQISAAASSLAGWSGRRDAIGITALAFAILTVALVIGLVLVFVLITGLSGLR